MLVENAQICRQLERVVGRLATNPTLREDLLQEGLLRLWQVECQFPGRTRSWYLQNCRFCILHWLAAGRSIDSGKRCGGGNRISLDDTESEGEPMEIQGEGDVVETVSFNDLQAVLSRQLTRRERAVLQGLADGLRLREIASEAKLSYPTALKYRRRIAALVSKLEFAACLEQGTQGSVRKSHENNHRPAKPEILKPKSETNSPDSRLETPRAGAVLVIPALVS